jgi:hypothetical protein
MKLKNILFATAAATLTACTNDSDGIVAELPLTVDANISGAVTTRMYNTTWEANDSIGISVSNNNGGLTSGTNMKYITTAGDGKFTSTTPIYFKDTKTVAFSAYYPYTDSTNISSSNLITVSTADQSKQKTFDYLFGTGSGTLVNTGGIPMTFDHMMAKITFKISAGNGASADNSFSDNLGATYKVKGLKHTGTFKVTDGSTAVTATDAADLSVNKDTASIIILPQTPTELKLVVTYNSTDYTATVTVPDGGFQAKNNYIYSVKVNETGLVVSSSTINNWTDSPQADADAEYEYPDDIYNEDNSGLPSYGDEEDLEFTTNK